jgi:hypothetical protein
MPDNLKGEKNTSVKLGNLIFLKGMKKGEEMIGKNREEERKVGRKGCAW